MNKEFITEIISRAVKDYGFRQVVLYNIEGINEYIETTEQIPSELIKIIEKKINPALSELPVPVEPKDQKAIINDILFLLNDSID
ncbi:MAG: hypothetical protein DK305_000517 [Chloroflexi bacterium]|jgi:hypothetical protein|nr:MAG: hypothetical protein DK305_000517 [Chloroflexota bacterium]|tara:strand:+ start:2661 stop:2915 length:255 start_codon:yes stop_codon:yes gene_type:complete